MSSGDRERKTGKSGGREQRLAAALRENLRRRKAQARGRDQTPGSRPSAGRPRQNGDPEKADR
jgi:hypothetical protein